MALKERTKTLHQPDLNTRLKSQRGAKCDTCLYFETKLLGEPFCYRKDKYINKLNNLGKCRFYYQKLGLDTFGHCPTCGTYVNLITKKDISIYGAEATRRKYKDPEMGVKL